MANWTPIACAKDYFIESSKGQILSRKRCRGTDERILKAHLDSRGYLQVKLSLGKGIFKTVLVHRLVAKAFIPNPRNLREVHHIDGNKLNNNAKNLKWCNRAMHMAKHGIPIVQLDEKTLEVVGRYRSAAEASRKTGISASGIRGCCNHQHPACRGYIWMNADEYEEKFIFLYDNKNESKTVA